MICGAFYRSAPLQRVKPRVSQHLKSKTRILPPNAVPIRQVGKKVQSRFSKYVHFPHCDILLTGSNLIQRCSTEWHSRFSMYLLDRMSSWSITATATHAWCLPARMQGNRAEPRHPLYLPTAFLSGYKIAWKGTWVRGVCVSERWPLSGKAGMRQRGTLISQPSCGRV